ncbi:ABC transporter substrate-binding protein [Pseudomonas fontis]|uniref:ABC transporter substrate-binding protein n=1 Tax=Pseudomonas fontis TaxID=2942633 RepID=A0ABT5NLH0_9PSED|nr:ABC transporter substrate-binding protein [Pseudomonas fontis]MDD0976153.1 ABC transporter substrate-binding protein [Pseudomonas fontis]MDD0989084.1 ABC transporter substrate-binding protein [Pseudomonas fontis]
MNHLSRLARLALLGAALLLAACKPPASVQGAAVQADGAQADGTLRYAANDYREAAPGRPGGTLRMSTASDTTTFDVHSISHGNVQWLGRILFDCLVYQDERGNISPWLAKSWDISPDGKTYTFHLRDDVTFSDGEKFNARAVQINLEHMRDPATKSPLAAAYIAPYVDGRVVDEYTFEAHLREPYSPFLDVLAQSWLSMISPRQILEAPKTIAQQPIGSGPFVLEQYTRDQGATFVKRQGYNWAPSVTGHVGEAYLDRLELSIVPEPMIRFSTLEARQSDFTLDAPAQNAQAIRANPDLQMRSRVRKANPFRSLTFNVERFPFEDVRVRRAVARAIDREGIAWIAGFGEFLPKGDFLAANTGYYDPAFKDALGYDVDAANRLLDEAGWAQRDPQGYRLKDGKRLAAQLLIYESGVFPGSIAVAIQADLKKIGFAMDIDLLPLAQITERRYASNFDAIAGGYWHTNTPDGLFILYHSQSISTPTFIGQNVGRLRDAALDQALSAARQAHDPAELARQYRIAQQRLVETVPAVPVFESHVLVAYRNAVKGVIFDTSHNTPFFTSVWLDQEAQ